MIVSKKIDVILLKPTYVNMRVYVLSIDARAGEIDVFLLKHKHFRMRVYFVCRRAPTNIVCVCVSAFLCLG